MGGFRLRGRCCLGEVKGMKLHSGMMGAWVGRMGVGGKAYWSGCEYRQGAEYTFHLLRMHAGESECGVMICNVF